MLISNMLNNKPKRSKPIKLGFIRELETLKGSSKELLYENVKTKTLYILRDNILYNMKLRVVNKDFTIIKAV